MLNFENDAFYSDVNIDYIISSTIDEYHDIHGNPTTEIKQVVQVLYSFLSVLHEAEQMKFIEMLTEQISSAAMKLPDEDQLRLVNKIDPSWNVSMSFDGTDDGDNG